jgi:hypothetical protein
MSAINRVKEDAARIIQDAKFEAITILVWGPGDPGSSASAKLRKAYAKRLQIKEVLKQEFPRATVHFSEDPEMIELGQGVKGQLRVEALQAKIADLVLMLDLSRGADLELDHFVPTYPWFRDKVHVFMPERYVSGTGLVNEVLKYIPRDNVEGFTEKEFKVCEVAKVKAVRAALAVALDSYLRHGA